MNHDFKTDNAQPSNTRINIINSVYLNITKFVKKKTKKKRVGANNVKTGDKLFQCIVKVNKRSRCQGRSIIVHDALMYI